MSKASDYRIYLGVTNAFFVKIDNSYPSRLSKDSRVISTDEILCLIDWYLNRELGDTHHVLSFDSVVRDDYRVQLTYERKEQDDECK